MATVTTETALNQFWQLVGGVLSLKGETFEQISRLPLSLAAALLVVLLAALSQSISQSAVLFINRVKPIRFILSLAIAAVIFTFNYNFWVLSTWLVIEWIFQVNVDLITIVQILGFSYAPLLFGFLMVIPYFGMPIFVVLSVWTLLAIITGVEAIAPLSFWQVFQCCIGGWIVLQLSQRIFGRPIAFVTGSLVDWIAGVKIVREKEELEQMLYDGLPIPASDLVPSLSDDAGE